MSGVDFFDKAGKKRVIATIAAIEAKSAAEVVVAVRARSWDYRHTHFLFGFATALAALSYLLFAPTVFVITYWPLEIALAFVIGAAFCMAFPPLERLLTARSLMAEQVERAAKATFVDLGVSATRRRTGMLVYVSMAERAATIIADVGVDPAAIKAYRTAERAILDAVRRADFEDFLKGLTGLAKPLAKALPRQSDDENELSDEVQ